MFILWGEQKVDKFKFQINSIPIELQSIERGETQKKSRKAD